MNGPGPRTVDRRGFLRGALGVGAVAALGGCSGAVAETMTGASTAGLTYWNLFGGGDGTRMGEMEQAYRKRPGSADLEAVTLTWGVPYYTKLAMAMAGGSPPDVAILHLSRMPQFGPSNLLRPFREEELARIGVSKDTIAPLLWEGATHDGRLYAVPLDTHPLVLYYNTDVCRKAGLLDADDRLVPIAGKKDLLDAFAAAQKVTGRYGVTFDTQQYSPWRLFWPLVRQQDAQLFSDDGSRYVLDDAAGTAALEFLRGLTHGSQLAPPGRDYAASVALFQAGAAGFHLNGEWEVTTFSQAGLPFDMTLMPQVFDNQLTWADSHSFVIPAGAEHVDAALTFIGAMLRESLTWAKGGHIPAYTPVRTSSKYERLVPQSHYASEIRHVAYDPPVWFSGAASHMEDRANSILAAVINDQLSPRAGLAQLRSSMEGLLALPEPF